MYIYRVKKQIGRSSLIAFAALIFWAAAGLSFFHVSGNQQVVVEHVKGNEVKGQPVPTVVLADQFLPITVKTEVNSAPLLKVGSFETFLSSERPTLFVSNEQATKVPEADPTPYQQQIRQLLFPHHSFS